MSDDRTQKILKELGHLRWTVLILIGMMIVMAWATYIESMDGHEAAMAKGFHGWQMDMLIVALAINLAACTVRRAPFTVQQYPWLVTHAGILMIMVGTIISHRTAVVGQIVLRQGQPEDHAMIFTDGESPLLLPLGFQLELDHFKAEFYPGTGKASNYVSHVRVYDQKTGQRDTLAIRVNHPIVRYGWNVSQSSFFPGDTTATVLGANKDPGTWYSYAGFLTVFLGLVGMFFLKPWLKKQFPVRRKIPEPLKEIETQKLIVPDETA